MKKLYVSPLIALVALTMLAGCAWQVGGDKRYVKSDPTIGQQLIDLQHARATGALSEPEYQMERAKILGKQ